MITSTKAVRITGIFHHLLTDRIVSAMQKTGISGFQIEAGRCGILKERTSFFGLVPASKLINNPVDVLRVLVEPEFELTVLNTMIQSGNLFIPGRGTVFSEDVTVYRSHDFYRPSSGMTCLSENEHLQSGISGICCILQRGQGDDVSRVALDTGTCVPAVTSGIGSGARDKLGLLRITIPAEKEIVHLTASSFDTEEVMNMLIECARLNQPGKAFIYQYNLRHGCINTKIFQGIPKHAASMEQIIVAIDGIKEGTAWRSWEGSLDISSTKKNKFLVGLVLLTLDCDDGSASHLMECAMDSGAPGATVSRSRQVFFNFNTNILPLRETCSMVIPESSVHIILEALENKGAFSDEMHGRACLCPVPKAYTYISRK